MTEIHSVRVQKLFCAAHDGLLSCYVRILYRQCNAASAALSIHLVRGSCVNQLSDFCDLGCGDGGTTRCHKSWLSIETRKSRAVAQAVSEGPYSMRQKQKILLRGGQVLLRYYRRSMLLSMTHRRTTCSMLLSPCGCTCGMVQVCQCETSSPATLLSVTHDRPVPRMQCHVEYLMVANLEMLQFR